MDSISLARGVPAAECIPVEELADCARAAVEQGGPAVLSYGPAGGYPPLREWLAQRHGVAPAEVVVTNGSLEGFVFLAAELIARRGARVLVEAPTYDRPLKILAELDADLVAVPLDDDGLRPDALEAALREGPEAAFLYTIPTFQNPTGRTLPLERRRRVVELAGRYGVPVVEDDPYGLVRFEGIAPPSLFELAAGQGVVYSTSFSKTIAPGVRVGYFLLPEDLALAVEARATASYISPPFLTQATVLEFLRRGNLEPNLARVRELLRNRRDALLAALELELPHARWSRPEGGYFLWVELPGGAPAAELLERAAGEVTFVPGADFYAGDQEGAGAARLAFSSASPREIAVGVARLAALLPPADQAAAAV